MNKKRLLNIVMVCYPGHGGSGVVASELGIALARQGHQVHFISYEVPFRLVDELLVNHNLHFHCVNRPCYSLFKDFPYSFVLANKLVQICIDKDIDLVHLHYAIPHLESAYVAKQCLNTLNKHVSVVSTLHGTDVSLIGKQVEYQTILNFLLQESDGITCVSEFLKKQVQESFDLKVPIKVIYNFVNPSRFSVEHAEEQEFLIPRDRKMILYTSNFRPVKNPEAMIRVFERVYKKLDNLVCLVLVGEGPELAKIRQMIDERPHLSHSVFFLGCIRHIETVFPLADVFVSTSRSESFGLCILEAMSCGVPVVASNVGGVPEVIVDKESGFLFNPEDEVMMANQIINIINEDLSHIGQNARKRVLEKFHVDALIQEYESFYDTVLSKAD